MTADNVKAAARLKDKGVLCFSRVQETIKLVDGLITYAAKTSDGLSDRTNSTVWTVVIAVGAGLLATIAAGLWIGSQGLSRPIGRLNAVMEMFARNVALHFNPHPGRNSMA